jgi:hypothetical protein
MFPLIAAKAYSFKQMYRFSYLWKSVSICGEREVLRSAQDDTANVSHKPSALKIAAAQISCVSGDVGDSIIRRSLG